jgi:hypothetical protein
MKLLLEEKKNDAILNFIRGARNVTAEIQRGNGQKAEPKQW